MSELFSLEKRAGLHSGSDTQVINRIAVFKPKGYPSTPESPEITSIIITSKETEQSVGVRYALAFDLTPKETEALIFCLQNAIKKEAPTPEVNYIGTKVYLTERGRELYGYSDVSLTSEWVVTNIEDKAVVTLCNKECGYVTKAIYASLFMCSEPQDFTFEKPGQPTVKQKSTANYIGKKVTLTPRGIRASDSMVARAGDAWEVKSQHPSGKYELFFHGYTTFLPEHLKGELCFEMIEYPIPFAHSLVGKKVRLTDKAISNLEIKPSMKGKIGKIQDVDNAGYCTLLFSDYDFSVVLLDYLSETPDFEIIEEPDMPTPINREGMFQTLPTPDFSAKATVLDKAKDLIYGDREKDYGKTSDNFADICTGWEIIFKNGFTSERVGLAMAWLKICRASTDNCEKEDSLVDLAGYAGCVEKIKKNL